MWCNFHNLEDNSLKDCVSLQHKKITAKIQQYRDTIFYLSDSLQSHDRNNQLKTKKNYQSWR